MNTESKLISFTSPNFTKECNSCIYLGTYVRDSSEKECDTYYCKYGKNPGYACRLLRSNCYIMVWGNSPTDVIFTTIKGASVNYANWISNKYYDADDVSIFTPELEGYLYQKKIKLHPTFTRLSWNSHRAIKILAVCALKTEDLPHEIMLLIILQFADTMRIP